MKSRFIFKYLAPVLAAIAATAIVAAQAASLKNPASLNASAPATFDAKFDTSAGTFVISVTKAWAPKGADRFYNLVKNGYYNDVRFFRVVSGFMVQFGINGDPALNAVWQQARLADDPTKESNVRGTVTFANAGPNSRTTQIFINFADNKFLDAGQPGPFAPFGKVTSGMEVVDKLYSAYAGAPSDAQPQIQAQGNAFLAKNFPKLDYVKTATIEGAAATPAPAEKAPAAKKKG